MEWGGWVRGWGAWVNDGNDSSVAASVTPEGPAVFSRNGLKIMSDLRILNLHYSCGLLLKRGRIIHRKRACSHRGTLVVPVRIPRAHPRTKTTAFLRAIFFYSHMCGQRGNPLEKGATLPTPTTAAVYGTGVILFRMQIPQFSSLTQKSKR